MLVKERITINGKEYDRTTSDNLVNPIVRCGKARYIEAIDPVGKTIAYFEESPTEEPETEDEENG